MVGEKFLVYNMASEPRESVGIDHVVDLEQAQPNWMASNNQRNEKYGFRISDLTDVIEIKVKYPNFYLQWLVET